MEEPEDSPEPVKENTGDATSQNHLHLKEQKPEYKRSQDDPVLLDNKFENEFGPLEDLTPLGSGYSGKVYVVTHVFEGVKYAVKRILLKVKKSSLVKMKRSSLATEGLAEGQYRVKVLLEENPRLQKLRREVEFLIKLQNEKNIVCYSDSWLEKDSSDSASSVTHGNKESSGNDGSSGHSSSVEFREDVKSSPELQCENNVGQNGSGLKSEGVASSGIHGNKESSGNDGSLQSVSWIEVFLCIRMELCSMDLKKWLKEGNKTFELSGQFEMDDEAIRIFKEIVEGLKRIHELHIMHTDLKPANIFLVGEHLTVKIGDFGFSKYIGDNIVEQGSDSGEHTLRKGGNLLYPAPEILKGSRYEDYAYYDCKVDIYSLGIILFEMYNRVDSESTNENKIFQLRNEGKWPAGFKQKNKVAASLIEKLIHKESKKRPTAEEILKDELFRPVSNILERRGKKTSTVEENGTLGVKPRADKLQEKATSVSPGAGDASAAEGLHISVDTIDSESTALPGILDQVLNVGRKE